MFNVFNEEKKLDNENGLRNFTLGNFEHSTDTEEAKKSLGCHIQQGILHSPSCCSSQNMISQVTTTAATVKALIENTNGQIKQGRNKDLETCSTDLRQNERMGRDGRMEYNEEFDVTKAIPHEMNSGGLYMGYGSDSEEVKQDGWPLESAGLYPETVQVFNRKYSAKHKAPLGLQDEQDKLLGPSLNPTPQQLIIGSSKGVLDVINLEVPQNSKKNTENNEIRGERAHTCSQNSSEDLANLQTDQINNTGSSVSNNPQDPTSTLLISQSGFSDSLNTRLTTLGSLVLHNGSLHCQPLQSPILNNGVNTPVVQSANNVYSCVMVPNCSNPISTVSIPVFSLHPSVFQMPLYGTNCMQLTIATTASIISDSFERVHSYMMAPSTNNPDSILSDSVSQPGLQKALSPMKAPSLVNPSSIITIPLGQPNNLRTSTTNLVSLGAFEQALSEMVSSINDPNSFSPILENYPAYFPVTSSNDRSSCEKIKVGFPTCTQDTKMSTLVTDVQLSVCDEDTESISEAEQISSSKMQDSNKSITLDTSVNKVNRNSGFSQGPNCDDNTGSILEAEQIPSSKTHESKASSPIHTQVEGVSQNLAFLQLSTYNDNTGSMLEAEQIPSRKTQDFKASTPVDIVKNTQPNNSVVSHFNTQEINKSTPPGKRYRDSELNKKTLDSGEKNVDDKERHDDIQKIKTSPGRPSLTKQYKHSEHKSTLIRVLSRYSETKGRYSPLIRVSKNVSPLQPIRGYAQQYVITHGHDKHLMTGREGKVTGSRVKGTRPIYLKGTPPQGYKRRLLTSAKNSACTKKVQRKKRGYSQGSCRSETTQDNDILEPTEVIYIAEEGQESSVLEKGFEGKTAREDGTLGCLSNQKLRTPNIARQNTQTSSNRTCKEDGSQMVFENMIPGGELYTAGDQDIQNPKTTPITCLDSGITIHKKTIGIQTDEEICTHKTQDILKTPSKTDLPKVASISSVPKTPINAEILDYSHKALSSKTLKTPVKAFKTPKTEDKERKREREHRNCLELRDGFQYLRRLLPGTKRTWSRVKILNHAVTFIKETQDAIKDFEDDENTKRMSWIVNEDGSTSVMSAREGLNTPTFVQESSLICPDHVVPQKIDSLLPEQYEQTGHQDEKSEGEDSKSTVYWMENVADNMQLLEDSIYIWCPTSSTEVDEHNVHWQVERNPLDDNGHPNIINEQDIAVKNIEQYRFNDSQIHIIPGLRNLYEELYAADEDETPSTNQQFVSEERDLPEKRDAVEGRVNSEVKYHGVSKEHFMSGKKLESDNEEVEVLGEGNAYSHNRNNESVKNYLELSSNPHLQDQYAGDLQSNFSPKAIYTTSPSLGGILSSPILLFPGEHVHSSSGSRDEARDQELPCSPRNSAYRGSIATKDLSPFIVPQSPLGYSFGMEGTLKQLQIEDFSQSPDSQETQHTAAYGMISEDAINYIGATVSPFATPRLGFLPAFTEVSPSQVIPDSSFVSEEREFPSNSNILLSDVTDFDEVGLISVAASVEVGSILEKSETNHRKNRTKPDSSSQKQDQATAAKNYRKRYKKVKSPSQKNRPGVTVVTDGTHTVDLSPNETRNIFDDYSIFKTPSPGIQKKRKRTPDRETWGINDNESEMVCRLPKKRGRKRKTQNADCKKQLIDEQSVLGIMKCEELSIVPSGNLRMQSSTPAKRGRKRKLDRSTSSLNVGAEKRNTDKKV